MPEEIEISKLHRPFKLHMYFYQNCKSVPLPDNFEIYFTMFQPRRQKRFRESRNVCRAPAEKSRESVREPGFKVLFTLFDSSASFSNKRVKLNFGQDNWTISIWLAAKGYL